MAEITWSLEPTDIEWEMDWTSMKANPAFKDREKIQKRMLLRQFSIITNRNQEKDDG